MIYFTPDRDFPFGFNILANIPGDKHTLFSATILETVSAIWGYNTPTPNFDQYIGAGIGILLEAQGTTFLSLKDVLTDPEHRKQILRQVKDPILKNLWYDIEKFGNREKRHDTSSTLNRVYAFLLEPLVRNCVCQKHNHMSFKDKIVIVDLKEHEIGKENASLLGALILTQLYIEGMNGLKTHL